MSLTTVVLSLAGGVLGGLLLAAPPAYAQSAVTSATPTASGTVGSTPPLTDRPGVPVDPAASESVACSGPVKLTTAAVSDPTMPPGVVVSIDARGLTCIGQVTGTKYVNSGQANLTRLLVANDVIKTTFAFYAPGGFLHARTAQLTLNLSYDTKTGALLSSSVTVGSFQ